MYYAEVQVRSIFEEGWSEIDHRIRYPYNQNNKLFSEFLSIFNRLSGSADEMGTFLQTLQLELSKLKVENLKNVESRDKTIAELRKEVNSLKIDKSEKDKINSLIKDYDLSREALFAASYMTALESITKKPLPSELEKLFGDDGSYIGEASSIVELDKGKKI